MAIQINYFISKVKHGRSRQSIVHRQPEVQRRSRADQERLHVSVIYFAIYFYSILFLGLFQ